MTTYTKNGLVGLRRRARNRVLQRIEQAPPKLRHHKNWYLKYHLILDQLDHKYGAPEGTAARYFAFVSPRLKVAYALRDVENLLAGRPVAYSIKGFAEQAISGAPMTGPKRIAFHDNLTHPRSSLLVTLDVWMARMFAVPHKHLDLKGVYPALAQGVSDAAEAADLRPLEAQALAWTIERTTHGLLP